MKEKFMSFLSDEFLISFLYDFKSPKQSTKIPSVFLITIKGRSLWLVVHTLVLDAWAAYLQFVSSVI